MHGTHNLKICAPRQTRWRSEDNEQLFMAALRVADADIIVCNCGF